MYLHHAVGVLTAEGRGCVSFVSDDEGTSDEFEGGRDPVDDARSDDGGTTGCVTGGRGPVNSVRIQDRVVDFVKRRLGPDMSNALDGTNQRVPLEPVLVEAQKKIALYVRTRQLRRWVRYSELMGETRPRRIV